MRLLTILVLTLVVVAFIDARSSISDKREIKQSGDAVSDNASNNVDHDPTENASNDQDENVANEQHETPKRLLMKRKSRIAGAT